MCAESARHVHNSCTKKEIGMIQASLYFDYRRNKMEKGAVRIMFRYKGRSSMITTGICVRKDQWNNSKVVNHPDARVMNIMLDNMMAKVNSFLYEGHLQGLFLGKDLLQVKSLVKAAIDPEYAERLSLEEERKREEKNSFLHYFDSRVPSIVNDGTRKLYRDTQNKIVSFCVANDQDPNRLEFSDITAMWLDNFKSFCLRTECNNTANRHLRDIRKIFNDALDEEITEARNPFRKYRMKTEPTRDKSFSAEELRMLFRTECPSKEKREAIDMFMLMFCLIGINCVDLAYAGKPIRGRLEYVRRKTGKFYSIRLEPEAKEIIQKYAGEELLLNILDNSKSYKTYFRNHADALKEVGKTMNPKESKRFSGICYGSARTSWATIAQEDLGIREDEIAAALGHSRVGVTSTYLRTEWRHIIDDINRRVLDWVLYGRR